MPFLRDRGEKPPQPPKPEDDLPKDEPPVPEGMEEYWANKVGQPYEPELPKDIPFDENATWEQRKIQQLGEARFHQLKMDSKQEHEKKLGKLQSQVQSALQGAIQEYQKRGGFYPVRAVAILGSWAEGKTHKDSDLDIFLLLNTRMTGVETDMIERLRKRGVRMNIEVQGTGVVAGKATDESVLDNALALFTPHRIIVRP